MPLRTQLTIVLLALVTMTGCGSDPPGQPATSPTPMSTQGVSATPSPTPQPSASPSTQRVLWAAGCGAPTYAGCGCQRNLDYCSQGVLARSDDLGETWTSTRFEAGLGSVDFPTPMNGWAVGAGGLVVRTTDGGLTWARKTEGIHVPPEATARALYAFNTVRFLDGQRGIIAGWGLTDEVIGREGPSLLYRPELFVLYTADGGESWTPATIVGGASATDDDAHDGTYAATACFAADGLGLIAGSPTLLSRDGGISWANISDRVVIDPAWSASCGQGGTLWLSQGASVVRSDDRGETWTLINDPDELPGNSFFSQIEFRTNEEGWRASIDLRRTDDGGRTWNVVESALPEGFAMRDIAFASADDGLWTSVGVGGVTHDGGETWRMVSIVPAREGAIFAFPDIAIARSHHQDAAR